jgi:hypothetical protein
MSTGRAASRLAAWLIVVAPYTIAVIIAFTALSGQRAAWPWALGLLLAVLGGAAGLAAGLGRRAIARLERRQVANLKVLADAAR